MTVFGHALNGSDPTGEVVAGSRASTFYQWHVRHHLVDQNGKWVRTTGDNQESEENDIGDGHILVGNAP